MENSEKKDSEEKTTKNRDKTRPKVKRKRKRLYESVNGNTIDNGSTKTDGEQEKVKTDSLATSKENQDKECSRIKGANEIVDRYVRWATGFSIVPVPLFDMASVFVIQLKMLKKLADHYSVNFTETIVKSLITSLIGALNACVIGGALMTSIFKLFPGTGLLAGITSMCLVSGATTYAIGKVFIQHFESGGTFLNFDPEKVKEYFKKQFEDGKNIAKKNR